MVMQLLDEMQQRMLKPNGTSLVLSKVRASPRAMLEVDRRYGACLVGIEWIIHMELGWLVWLVHRYGSWLVDLNGS